MTPDRLSLAAFLMSLTLGLFLHAQEKKKEEPKLPDFPRVNLATCYEVAPAWPENPKAFPPGDVPGIAVNSKDEVYVFTRAKPPVRVYSTEGKLLRSWGSDTVETAHHIKIDQGGNVWLADIGLHVVRQFTPEGKLLKTFGIPGEFGEDERRLKMPTDMAIAPNGDVFISDGYGNNRIVHFDGQGKFIKAWGKMGTGSGDFSLPHAIVMDSKGRLYVADRNNVRVLVYNQDGKLLNIWNNLIVPWGFWINAKDEIWVCGSSPMPWRDDPKYKGAPLGCPPKDQVILKFNPEGKVLQHWTFPKGEDEKEKPGDLNWVHALAVDSQGNLYLGDIIGKRAQKFSRMK
ncbi:MAG: 6-bladed beta-propeller [Gemmataceae bacterium]|nr:6-bladed beta-propeller [Gemmataceae bacterium]